MKHSSGKASRRNDIQWSAALGAAAALAGGLRGEAAELEQGVPSRVSIESGHVHIFLADD